jgi:solute:Na+ symporter, SSS family
VVGNLRWPDAAVIVAYLSVLAGIGFRFSRRQTSTERYFTARRSIPGWATGLSLLATLISSVTFIGYPGSAFAGDWSNLVPGLTVLLIMPVTAAVIIPFYRHHVGVSAYEYFGKRFGYPARAYGSIAYAAGHLSKMGFVFYLLALTVSGMSGWNTERVILSVGAITVCYTLAGGIEGVIWADVVQGFALWAGLLISLGYLLLGPAAGPGAMLQAAWSSGKIALGSPALDFSKPTFWVLSVYGLFYYFQRYACDQTVVQRYLAARSDRDASRGVQIGSYLCIPVWTLFMLAGTLCWVYFRSGGEPLPSYAAKADQAFPFFISTHIPSGLAGLFVAALFGAAMSNLSADLNALSAVGVEDYFRAFRPHASERRRLLCAKLLVAAFGALCVAVATALAHTNGAALSMWYTVSAIASGGLFGLFLLAFLVPRAGAVAAYSGIAASLLFTAYATLTADGGKLWNLGRFNFPLHAYMIGVIGHVVLVMIGLAVSAVAPNRNASSRQLAWGGERRKTAIASPAG